MRNFTRFLLYWGEAFGRDPDVLLNGKSQQEIVIVSMGLIHRDSDTEHEPSAQIVILNMSLVHKDKDIEHVPSAGT